MSIIETFVSVLTPEIALAAAVSAAGGVLHGYTGFGAALLIVPLLTVIYGPVEAIVLSLLAGAAGIVQLLPAASRQAGWREMAPLAAAIVITTPIGVFLLFTIDPDITRRAIGAFVLLTALALMTGWVYRGRRGAVPAVVAGSLCGAITGFAGVGGPPVALYYLASPEPAGVQRANIVIAVGVVIVAMMVSVGVAGGIGVTSLARAVVIIPGYVAGAWAGARLFTIAPEALYRRIALWLLLVTGAIVLAL